MLQGKRISNQLLNVCIILLNVIAVTDDFTAYPVTKLSLISEQSVSLRNSYIEFICGIWKVE